MSGRLAGIYRLCFNGLCYGFAFFFFFVLFVNVRTGMGNHVLSISYIDLVTIVDG